MPWQSLTEGTRFHARPSVELPDLGIVGSGFHARQPVVLPDHHGYICANDKGVEIPRYVIMPNHVYMGKHGRAWKPDPTASGMRARIIPKEKVRHLK